MGLEPGPDSPPTMAHWIPLSDVPLGTSERRGSNETNRTLAGTIRSASRRCTYRFDSTVTPIQMFGDQVSSSAYRSIWIGRLVRIWNVCQLAAFIVAKML